MDFNEIIWAYAISCARARKLRKMKNISTERNQSPLSSTLRLTDLLFMGAARNRFKAAII